MFRRITTFFLILLLGFALATPADSQYTLRVGVELVNVSFSVTDRKGRFVTGLGPDDFIVEEEGKRQRILHFSRENERSLTLALLIDTSPSVQSVFSREKETAVAFLRSVIDAGDLALVIGFDRSVTLVADYSEDVDRLVRGIHALDIGDGTALYDAVYLASKEKLEPEAGRKAVILISDGEDTASQVELKEALIEAHRSDAVIYSIACGPSKLFRGRRSGDTSTLKKLSDETGGTTFTLGPNSNLGPIFEQIADELRSQYSLAYVSTDADQDGKFRRIKIIPRNRSLKVRARKGYYAPSDVE